jgi:hypothetical protein
MKTLMIVITLLAQAASAHATPKGFWAIQLDVWGSSTRKLDKTPRHETWPQTFGQSRKNCEIVRRMLRGGDVDSAFGGGPAGVQKFESRCEFLTY